MPRAIRFEIAAMDLGTLSAFYDGLFGWQFERVGDQDYFMIDAGTGPGIDGALTRRFEGGPGVINTIGVASVDKSVSLVMQLGGAILVPKFAIPGSGYMAYCVDPENNVFGVMELDEQAS